MDVDISVLMVPPDQTHATGLRQDRNTLKLPQRRCVEGGGYGGRKALVLEMTLSISFFLQYTMKTSCKSYRP